MITYSKLGSHGRFGNQLFQIAFLYTLADRFGVDWTIPRWKYAEYFQEQFPMSVPAVLEKPAAVLKEGPYMYQKN